MQCCSNVILDFIWKIFKLKGNPPITKLIVHLMGTEFTLDISKVKNEVGYSQLISVDLGLQNLKLRN